MLHALGGDPTDPTTVLGYLLNYGPLGLVLVFILVGWLVPRGSVAQIIKDRDAWREVAAQERAARQAAELALEEAGRRAEVAIEVARTANALLEKLHQAGGNR